jgi:hypothetical protein
MPFPLCADPAYRRLLVTFWLDDVDDRLSQDRVGDAEISWKNANGIYLSLPPGEGDEEIEGRIYGQRVKLDKLTTVKP